MKFHEIFTKMPIYEETLQVSISASLNKDQLYCESCEKIITSKRQRLHINICQTPVIHVFCSKNCKNRWCFDQPKREK